MRLFVAGFAHSLKICKKLTFSFIYFGYWFFSTTIHAIRFFSTAPLIQNSLNQIFCGICQASWFFIWYQIICFWTSFNQSIYISTVSSLCLMSALLNCFITVSAEQWDIKVHIFWEGHKILRNVHRRFDWQYIIQIMDHWDFAKLCSLLRIYEL